MAIPEYPKFSEIDFSMKEEIENCLSQLRDGCSEYFFSNIYFFRNYYQYRISRFESGIVISGVSEGKPFCMIPKGKISENFLRDLVSKFTNLSFISESLLEQNKDVFLSEKFSLKEDRNNFDYVYLRENLAKLSGKKFHKKRNHVNKFSNTHTNIEVKPLGPETASDALNILERWKLHTQPEATAENEEKNDFEAAKTLLENISQFSTTGIVLYVEGLPVAWTAGEISQDKKTAVIYFEKADISYPGAFQYVNYAFANFLPETVEYINREQDLGKPGLIYSKQTYHPVFFIKKYTLGAQNESPGV